MAWIVADNRLSPRRIAVKIFIIASVCVSGFVARSTLRLLLKQAAGDTAISVLGLSVTLLAAYGVYVAQSVDKGLESVKDQFSKLQAENSRTQSLNVSLQESLDRQHRQLSAAIDQARIQWLRQTILVHLPELSEVAPEIRADYGVMRNIVKDSIAHIEPRQVLFDCEELARICRDRSISEESVLGKSAASFEVYRTLAANYAAQNRDSSDWAGVVARSQ